MTTPKTIFNAAKKCADWMLRNQIINRLDANSGRFLWEFNQTTGEKSYSTSWDTGCSLMGLLALWKRTRDSQYLDRAEHAGHYLMSLQVLDQRTPKFYGAFHEVTPQSVEFCPRDACSAAWAFVWLYEATKNQEYLDRAILFANWLLNYGMYNNWPKWAVFMDGQPDFYARGSFQSGCGLFFYDLFRQTGDQRYIDQGMRPVAEIYLRDFLQKDGSIITQRDGFTNKPNVVSKSSVREVDMHNFNDDFGTAMLLRAAELFGEDKYNQAALSFAKFLIAHQDSAGTFNHGKSPSALPQALIYFSDLAELFPKEKQLVTAKNRALTTLLNLQFNTPNCPELNGAFPQENHPGEPICGLRTSMYALTALLHIESGAPWVWLSNHTPTFQDALLRIKTNPPVFKW